MESTGVDSAAGSEILKIQTIQMANMDNADASSSEVSLDQNKDLDHSVAAGTEIEAHTSIEIEEIEEIDTSSSAFSPTRDAHATELASSSAGPQNEIRVKDSYNRPDNSLIINENSYKTVCEPLQMAARKGDWKRACSILQSALQSRERLSSHAITKAHETALHIAAGARQIDFGREIIQLASVENLALQDQNGNTAFCIAAAAGSVEIAKVMLRKNPNLVTIKGDMGRTPLYMAVMLGRKEMAMFLYKVTSSTENDRLDLFFKSIETDLYGIALKLLESCPELAWSRKYDNHETAFHLLARKPSSKFIKETKFTYRGESKLTQALQLLLNLLSSIKKPGAIYKQMISHSTNFLFDAAKSGNFKFLSELIRSDPSLVHQLDNNKRTIFHIAILLRQTSVFNLINELGFHKEIIATYVDDGDNNMLHLAAMYPDNPPASSLSSAALEMQQELLLFEEVEKLMQPSLREAKNAEGLTPRELLIVQHRGLVKSGAEWMKGTASSCMVVATLIATVVFSAAFTIPGGNQDETGNPILLEDTSFRVFAIADAAALSSSSFSILMFLSILTSGFAQNDFRKSLPLKLMIGLLALFISIISMMITFSSSYFLVYHDKPKSIPILVLILVTVPITLFALLQYHLLRDIFLLISRYDKYFQPDDTYPCCRHLRRAACCWFPLIYIVLMFCIFLFFILRTR